MSRGVTIAGFKTFRAAPSDAEDMALAHRDSIRSIGPGFYPANVVADWEEGIAGDVYLRAMEGGEVFFIATGEIDGARLAASALPAITASRVRNTGPRST